MYTVVYEDGDGDKEDLDPQECEEVVTLSDDVTIKEWEGWGMGIRWWVGSDGLVYSIYDPTYSLLGLFYQQSTNFFKMD